MDLENIKADLGEVINWSVTITNGAQSKRFSGNTSKYEPLLLISSEKENLALVFHP